MADTTFIEMVVSLLGTPNTFVGWVIIDVLAFFLLAVLITLMFTICFFLFSRR